MSVSFIDHNKTTSYTKGNVVIYKNPGLAHELYSDGRVYSPSRKKFLDKTANGFYSVRFVKGSKVTSVHPSTFESLVCHVLGIKREKRTHVELIDVTKGYVKDNIKIVPIVNTKSNTEKSAKKVSLDSNVKTIPAALHEAETSIVTINGYKLKCTKANLMYITEDYQTFNNKDDAISHQLDVDKGKEAARMVIDAKGGHVLAEQIFQTHVNNNKKMYQNFIDVINNSSGVKELGKSDSFKFIDQSGLGDYKKDILNGEFTYDQAEKVSSLLKTVEEASLQLIEVLSK